MQDNFTELEDRTAHITMAVVGCSAIVAGQIADDPTVMYVGGIVFGVPLVFSLALLRHAWNKRRRRRVAASRADLSSASGYPPSTRRT